VADRLSRRNEMMKKRIVLIGLVLLFSPAAARADWLFTPHLGSTFGGGGGFTYGASIGWMGAGIVGWEAEFAHTPGIFDLDNDLDLDTDTDLIDDAATSMMFNAIIGAPIGGTSGGGFRPYLGAGVGWFMAKVQSDELLFEEKSDKFGFNIGGGAMGYFGKIGVRGDVRYYQTLSDSNIDNALNVELGDYDFWRGTVGVTFRW
jgi:opacity protein-like surface antigen